MPLREARAAIVQPMPGLTAPGPVLASVADRTIPTPSGSVNARVYTPLGVGPFPLIVFFHGGGFVLGDLEIDDSICRDLAGRGGCVVLSVDYRLAPEHKFPAASDDCLAATRWAAENGAAALQIDPSRIVVAGMSAGGNLAAVTALRIRDQGGPPLRGQLLGVPVTDHCVPETDSYRRFATGYMLLRDEMVWFWEQYLNAVTDANEPYAAPMRAHSLSGLPPAFIATAEYDVLRDEGEAYGRRLREAGVDVTARRYAGVVHTFGRMTAISAKSRQFLADATAWLNVIVGGTTSR
jgi:acetyl esterase